MFPFFCPQTSACKSSKFFFAHPASGCAADASASTRSETSAKKLILIWGSAMLPQHKLYSFNNGLLETTCLLFGFDRSSRESATTYACSYSKDQDASNCCLPHSSMYEKNLGIFIQSSRLTYFTAYESIVYSVPIFADLSLRKGCKRRAHYLARVSATELSAKNFVPLAV